MAENDGEKQESVSWFNDDRSGVIRVEDYWTVEDLCKIFALTSFVPHKVAQWGDFSLFYGLSSNFRPLAEGEMDIPGYGLTISRDENNEIISVQMEPTADE